MYKSFFRLQQGLISPYNFKEEETKHRSFNLQLSKQKDVQNTFDGNVNYLDLEKSENRYILSGCSDGSIYIHDLFNFSRDAQFSAQCVTNIHRPHGKSVECVTWYPNDNRVFASSGGDCKLILWDANSKKILEVFNAKGRVFRHAWCQDSHNLIAVASLANVVDLIDFRTGNESHGLRGHKDSVTDAAWSPRNPEILVTGGRDCRVLMWDVRSAAGPLFQLNWNGEGRAHSGPINCLSFTPDGLHVLSFGSDRKIKIWETSQGKSLFVNYGRISNNAQRHVQMAVGNNVIYLPNKGRISVFNLWTGEPVGDLCGHFNTVLCCVYRDIYQELYSGGMDRNVLIWTAENLTYQDGSECDGPVADEWSSDES